MSNYPSGFDALVDPTATDPLDSLTVPHAGQHADANTAIEAIQHAIGLNPQGTFASALDRIEAGEAAAGAAVTDAQAARDAAATSAGTATTQATTATTQAGVATTQAGIATAQVAAATAQAAISSTMAGEAALSAFTAAAGVQTGSILRAAPVTAHPAERLLKQAVWWIDAQHSSAAGQKIRNLGWGGTALDAQAGSVAGSNIAVVPGANGYVYLPGVLANYLSVPASTSYDTEDADIAACVAFDVWPPPNVTYMGIGDSTSANQYRMLLSAQPDGKLRLSWGDGATGKVVNSTATVPAVSGGRVWLRGTMDYNAGGTYSANFYYSFDAVSGTPSWTQLGTAVTGAQFATGPVTGKAVQFSANSAGSAMKAHRLLILNGIAGTTVLDIDAARIPTPTTRSFITTTGQTVTINESGADINDPKFLDYSGTPYVYLPGVTGNGMTMVDGPEFDVTDLDVRVRVALDDWTPATVQALVAKYGGAGQRSFVLAVDTTTGVLFTRWTADGTTVITKVSTASPAIADGNALWVRLTIDVDNGASGNDVKFWTSPDGTTWTQLGTTLTTAGVTSIFASTAGVEIGSQGSTLYSAGKVYRAIIKNGIDGPTVLDIDTSVIGSGAATTINALTGQTVTISRGTTGRKSVAVVAPVWLFGTDDYMEVPDSDLLDFGATDSFTVIAATRRWNTQATGPIIAKTDTTAATTAGWLLMYATANRSTFIVADGTNRILAENSNAASGSLVTSVGVRDVASDTGISYVNGVATAAADPTTATSVNALTMRVGRLSGAGANYLDGEGHSFAVFRRVLTVAEVQQVSDWMKGRAY